MMPSGPGSFLRHIMVCPSRSAVPAFHASGRQLGPPILHGFKHWWIAHKLWSGPTLRHRPQFHLAQVGRARSPDGLVSCFGKRADAGGRPYDPYSATLDIVVVPGTSSNTRPD